MCMERRLCQKGRAEKAIMQTTLQPNRSSKSVLLVWRTLQDGVGMRMRRQDVSASRSQRVFCQQRHVRKQIGRRLTHYKRGQTKMPPSFPSIDRIFMIIMLTFPRNLPPQRQIVCYRIAASIPRLTQASAMCVCIWCQLESAVFQNTGTGWSFTSKQVHRIVKSRTELLGICTVQEDQKLCRTGA